MSANQSKLKGFIVLSRLPFLSPGLSALISGIGIAAVEGYDLDEGLVGLSILGVALIMLATYYFNEYFDYEGDMINKVFTQLSGGSRALPNAMVSRRTAKIAGFGTVAILVAIAVTYFLFFFEDYPLLLPLGLFGAFCGVFYSSPPFQWAYQGIGEIIIGGCYGVLAFISGFYLASGDLDLRMVLIGIPAALTVFGIILSAEFPDRDADEAVGKRTLAVRLGLRKASIVYVVAMALAYPIMLSTMIIGAPVYIAFTGLPVLILCAGAIRFTLKGGYAIKLNQTRITALTILANMTSCFMFPLAYYLQGL